VTATNWTVGGAGAFYRNNSNRTGDAATVTTKVTQTSVIGMLLARRTHTDDSTGSNWPQSQRTYMEWWAKDSQDEGWLDGKMKERI